MTRHLLLIGLSRIATKRVLPALSALSAITRIDIASRKEIAELPVVASKRGDIFHDYDIGITRSRADIAYISLVNSEHERFIEKALKKGMHVIVDKPACLTLTNAERLSELAKERGVCLAEAVVYGFHPQIVEARRLFEKGDGAPNYITATFSFPPLAVTDFRYTRKLGGGALFDLGAYAVSSGRLFFGGEPEDIVCKINEHGGRDLVETSFSVLCHYKKSRSMVGHFGFTTEYRNRLELLGKSMAITVDRAFTPPADADMEIIVREKNSERKVQIERADSFQLFFEAVLESLRSQDFHKWSELLVSDMRVLSKMRIDAGAR